MSRARFAPKNHEEADELGFLRERLASLGQPGEQLFIVGARSIEVRTASPVDVVDRVGHSGLR
jgi:hypothetical protein